MGSISSGIGGSVATGRGASASSAVSPLPLQRCRNQRQRLSGSGRITRLPAASAFRRNRGFGADPDSDPYQDPDPKSQSELEFASPSAAPAPRWGGPNPVDLVKREAGLQSNRLDGDVRERVEAAVERLGCRVTVGDVAARAGVKLSEADEALKALAYDTGASLQVSAEGDVVYGFAPDFRSALRGRSVLLRLAPLARRAAGVAWYLTRVAFGSALIASVVVVWLAVAALLSGRSNDDRDRNGRSGGGGGGYYGGGYHSTRLFLDVTDLFIYWDPNYERRSAERAASQGRLGFVESIFSFVFGDGDPNADWEARRWRQLAEMVRARGGVVTAEEMAPYLDPPEPAPPPSRRRARQYDDTPPEPYVPYPDEGFVLPALIKFGGEPVVDEAGRLLYRFPALQRTGVKQQIWSRSKRQQSFDVPAERTWEFTAATAEQAAMTVMLGLFNLVGVGLLSGLMRDPRSAYMLAAQGLGWLPGLLGPLQLYALAFFAIPAARWFVLSRRNAAIESRNEARETAAELLNGRGAAAAAAAAALDDKLAAARNLGERTAGAAAATAGGGRLGPKLVSEREIIFDSGREAAPQVEGVEMGDWDARMAGRVAEQEGRLRGRVPQRGRGLGSGGGGGGGGNGADGGSW